MHCQSHSNIHGTKEETQLRPEVMLPGSRKPRHVSHASNRQIGCGQGAGQAVLGANTTILWRMASACSNVHVKANLVSAPGSRASFTEQSRAPLRRLADKVNLLVFIHEKRDSFLFQTLYQYVPHKAVAEVSKIANYRRLVAVNHGSQSEPTDGPTSGWRPRSVV